MREADILGIKVNVGSNEEIAAKRCAMVVVPLRDAAQPLDEHYVPGTLAGFFCQSCGQECILAPSGQAIFALGKNPLICMDCFVNQEA